ncbi:unnamed protein product [Caenorhabditis angaria]|uniref:Uncharacterized protein n=1 Tax=Caenorhabditis angaria TaxID=860376 RepID=A0A9P1IYL5_9PELO|nr:unnamed protein product [Caenorhabditis angaria]
MPDQMDDLIVQDDGNDQFLTERPNNQNQSIMREETTMGTRGKTTALMIAVKLAMVDKRKTLDLFMPAIIFTFSFAILIHTIIGAVVLLV